MRAIPKPRFAMPGYQPRIIGYTKNGCPIREAAGGAPTIEELILSTEVELEQEKKRYERGSAEVKNILNKAKHEGRANLTAEEDQDVDAAMKSRGQAHVNIKGIEHKLERARQIKEQEDHADLQLRERHADPVTAGSTKPAYDRVARIGSEERTYHRGNSGKGGLFVRDVMQQYLNRDLEAEQRLSRHMQEERVERGQYLQRASGTGNFVGLTVPQYLTDMYAPAVAALRPFADVCNKHDLPPDGMTINISRITTPTAVGIQTTENAGTGIGSASISDTLLTENVLTAAGTGTLSRQAIERGTGIEDVTMSDLQRQYATNLDGTLINAATTGLSALGVATAFTSTAPTGALFYPKVLGALAGSEAALLAQAMPNYIVMHSRRWYWLSSQMTATWPLISQPNFPWAVAGSNEGKGYNQGVRGVLPNGLLVVVDNNISLTAPVAGQDEAYVVASDECHLWEDPNAPQFIRCEQPAAGTLGVQLVLYGYFAFSFRRYANAVQKISGTGMSAPSF